MWSAVVSSIFLVTCVDFVISERNGSSLPALNHRLSKFKTDVHRIFQGTRIRVKRQLEGSDPLIRKLKFGKVTQVDLPYLSDLSLSFWLSIESRNQVLIGTIEGNLKLFEMLDDGKQADLIAQVEYGKTPIKARAFSYHDEQWFVVLHNLGNKFRIQLYKRIGHSLNEDQSIDLNGVSDIELVEMKGIYYLVVATYSTETNQGYSYQASVKLYHWTQTQFDEIASRVTYGARSLDCWTSDGSLYIVVGQESNDEGNLAVGSPVYIYNSKEENKLVVWQMIATYGPSKVRHFYSADNRYLIFTGKQDAVIYWWSSGQFLEWQHLEGTADALDVSVLSLGDEAAIVVVLKEDALIYTLDTSGYYVISFSMSFKGSNLLSLQFMFSRNYYYALALFEESQSRSTWKLELSPHFLPSVDSLDILQECLLETWQKVAARQKELEAINSDIMRVWRKGSNQTLKTKVTVQGRIWSRESKVKDVIILKLLNIPRPSLSFVMVTLAELKDSVEDAKRGFDTVVLKSERQIIKGFKHFAEHVYVPSLRMSSTNNDISINDVRVSRLKNYALKKVGNQVVPVVTVISNVFTETVHVDAINGISTQDLLLLHGKQFVTGNLEFSGISAGIMSVETINSIPIEDVVITTSPQVIKDFKTFSRLASHSISVQGAINEVHLGSIYKKIATVNSYNEFVGHITFQNPWTVGSISLTRKLNKIIDISKLVSQSVNRDSQQDLTGFFTFNSGPTIDGDLFVMDSINGVSTDNLLTIDSNQIIFADIVFESSLSVARDAIVDAINNVDIGEQAVLKYPPHQFITGRKIFKVDMSTEHVEMSEYVTLDHVDPSFLVQDLVQHRQGVVNSSSLVFSNVEVLGDVTAKHDLNDHTLDFLSAVWLKSIVQNITTSVKVNNLHLEHDLEVHRINDLDPENDFVSSYTSEVIESSKSFHSEIVLKSLTAENAKINGVDLKSLKTEIDLYANEKNIKGMKSIHNLEILGKLNVKKLNDIKISEIMLPNEYQIVSGPVEFRGEITVILGNAESEAISFGLINDLDIHEYFEKAVPLTNPSLAISNKHFEHIKAKNLYVPFESRIAGVNLQDMMERVVRINVPQVITASKSFISEVDFSSVTTTSLNDLQLTNYLNEIVFSDEVSKISHKQFLENVQASNVFVRGTVNGINLGDMASNVFYKSEDNKVEGHFTFVGDMNTGYLSSPVIDEVKWDDLILIQSDQVLESAWFLSNIHAHKDVFITGLLNGCDLSLASSSIYTNKTTQVISKTINVDTVLIVGNLEVKEKINGIQLELLRNLIILSDDQVLTSDFVIDDGLVVDNLTLENSLDYQNMEFLLTDAVRHSLPQEIKGYKQFDDNVNVGTLNGGDLLVSKLDGVDLEEMKSTSVLKEGYQEIEGEKIFPSLFMNVATIKGFLNGLKLPQDVVTTDGSDNIASPVYFMSDVYVPDQIVVYGLVDGVDLDELIHHRVTVDSEQNITAQLILHDDIEVRGELTIEGTVNDLVLELVANVKSVNSLQGYKVFLDFYVSGSLSASSVNGYKVLQLDANIVRHDKDDYINEIQTFQKPIHSNSMYVEWINDISVNWLKGAFAWMINTTKPALKYLRSLSYNFQQQLAHQLSTTRGRESKFAYFTLHQEINTGPATRILRSHAVQDDDFSHSLVMWNKQKRCVLMDICCHLEFSYWLRVTKSGIVMVDEAAESGKYYPILDPSQNLLNKDFYLWTNLTYGEPKLCGSKSNKLFIAAYSEKLMETSISLENSPQLSDVKTFRKGHLYAVAAFYFDSKQEEYGNTTVYAYHETGQWYEHQVLPSFGVLSLDIATYNRDFKEDILLAVGTGMDAVPMSLSTIYKWSSSNRRFEVLQNIPSRYVASTLWITMGPDLLLSLANVEVWPVKEAECSELVSGGYINIYMLKEKLEWIQSIPVGGIVSMVSFSLDGDTYLAAASSHQQTVYIFEWKGYSGFVQIQSISVDAQHLNVYDIDDDVYMTIASASSSSKVLKMVKKGKQSSKRHFEQMFLEQKDQVPQSSRVVTSC